ncbi:glutamine ABC superfamily ATP binding cassette transporter, binding protein [Sporosarcina newyorkensis 2681]|uniref:Glutamine ABC superfamily ATP binding cassette transporter, binding protein n=1 Tax=Sporosarcina newyorkensis 2681 TaxID=1027292 RepID=F9DXF5_9BACL|nr:transporter substrate-binding domain-containing protein [Sporosarcina newyorkensis]EGQ20738.1 glutamine ABC superfamily ATP binding cassette transporter, binding protein [Sporosarcina newyorkensis 2681]
MKKFILLMVLSIISILFAACGGSDNKTSSEKEVAEDKTYVVGVDNTYPPFEFEADGKLVGIDIDLIHAIAEDQGFNIKIEQMDFSGIIPSMQAGELDIGMGGMSITDERKKTVDFSDPYFEAGISLVIADNNTEINSLEDLAGKKVVIKNGTVSAKFAEENKDKYNYEIVQVNDSTSMFQEVTNGTVDALMEDYPVISYAIAVSDLKFKIVGDRLTGDNYGISVLKGKNDELLEMIDKGLANLKENGTYDEILNKYLD